MKEDLIDYLIENLDKENAEKVDLIRYNIGSKIYYYGDQFKKHKKNPIKRKLRDVLEFMAIIFFKKSKSKGQKKILSSAYSSWNKQLEIIGYDVYNPCWNFTRAMKIESSSKLYFLTKKINRYFEIKDFNYLISKDFFSLINEFSVLFKEECIANKYEALILPQDVGFFEKMAIHIFKELKLPTIFWAHGGMPNRYDGIMSNRTDYSIQWGQAQVDAFVKNGYDSSKFFISGHPIYNTCPKELKFSLENITVLTKSLTGVSPQSHHQMEDRGNAIMYLYSIQKVLEKIGVKKVLLRPHPSENFSWYEKYIDNDFFVEDKLVFSESLKRATLVIGPVSTSLIDSLHYSVNYLVYEPLTNGKNIYGLCPTPPLDGLNPKIPIANSEEELEIIIKEKRKMDVSVYNDFAKTPKDLSFFKKII
ncbi:hypothetical protein [Tenacibaculum ovolyticum]|uniref:hypothetical protein n=1 Tax=Tenacibaculum ovolyticum TaxID=104270 RepID=UPI001F2A53F0|nr:hypothetical protein [Tenacibaculum ovolyticum]